MPGRFGATIVFALLLASPLRSASAEPVDPTPAFIAELQAAIRNDDKDWLSFIFPSIISARRSR
jgi:hypothetical protein